MIDCYFEEGINVVPPKAEVVPTIPIYSALFFRKPQQREKDYI